MTVTIMVGDVRKQLKLLPDESVHCVVTSPPYWALRDYGTATWEGGDAGCDHRSPTMRDGRDENRAMLAGSAATNNMQFLNAVSAGKCGKCGAIRVDSQLGLEPTPQLHVATMVDVFREVKRVLRKDGVCWVNYGDSYAGSINGRSAEDTKAIGNDDRTFRNKPINNAAGGLKPKDLCGVPFRFALAMQDDGWWWRSCLPWVKRNGMPESITDRPATSIEYVFMFTKSARYWYDHAAVRRELAESSVDRLAQNIEGQSGSGRANGGRKTNGPMKAVAAKQEAGERAFAHRKETVAERARFEEHSHSGSRNFRNSDLFFESLERPHGLLTDGEGNPLVLDVPPQPFRDAHFATFPPNLIEPLIKAGCPLKGTVLDPFGGAGTSGLVADRLGRDAILIELNPAYAEIARNRIKADAGMFAVVA